MQSKANRKSSAALKSSSSSQYSPPPPPPLSASASASVSVTLVPEGAAPEKKKGGAKRFSSVVQKIKRSSAMLKSNITSSGSSSSSSRTAKKVLFGVPLDKIMGEHTPPLFLRLASQRVCDNLSEEGLFRVSGTTTALVELKSVLEECERERIRSWVKRYGRHAPVPPSDSCPIDFAQVPVHTPAA